MCTIGEPYVYNPPNTPYMILPLIKEQIAEIQRTMYAMEKLVNQILEQDVNSQTCSDLSDAASLLEIYENSLRQKRQLLDLKLRKHYLNQYLELHRNRRLHSNT
jgi:hypothetical protein